MDAYNPITTSQKLSLPLNGTIHTTTRKVPVEKKLPEVGDTMGNELGPKYAGSIVIESSEVPTNDGQKTQTLVHASIPSEAEQLESNWEYATCSIGGNKYDGVTRTVIFPAKDFNRTSPAPASAMPVSTDAAASDYDFTGQGYILVSRNVNRQGMQLEPYFRVETRMFVKRVSMVAVGIDGLNGKPLFETTTLYHASETVTGTGTPNITAAALFAAPTNAWWGIQSTGFENSGQMLSSEWYALVSSQVVAGTITGGVVAVATITSNDDFDWPPVLQFVEYMDWQQRNGGTYIQPRPVWKHEAYSGPCATTTVITWSKEPFTIPPVVPMMPNRIVYSSPFFNLNIPACLHGTIVSQCNIGNTDPDFTENSGSARVTLATNYTDWPDTIVTYDDQKPYRGGYLRYQKTTTSPNISGGGGGGSPVVTVPTPTGLAASAVTSAGCDLDWSSVSGATNYLIQVATDADFANLVLYRRPAVFGTSDTIDTLNPSTTYWARVSALTDYWISAPSSAVTFTTTA